MTALNLFTTKFDQVLDLLENKAKSQDECPSHIIIDTPGQIEIFTWSASGAIICESIAALFPTVVVYVVDTERCKNPATFMSNMLYACSIMYKTKLPFIAVFNKTDIEPYDFALSWMQDFTVFQEALSNDESYMASLVHSMSLVLEEFYQELNVVGVSALTGDGVDDFLDSLIQAAKEYELEYLPEFQKLFKQREDAQKQAKEAQMSKLMEDLKMESKEQ